MRVLIGKSLEDSSVSNYFERGHVRREEVIAVIDESDFYEECLKASAFKEYAAEREEVDEWVKRKEKIHRVNAVNWRTCFIGLAAVSVVPVLLFECIDKIDTFYKILLGLFSVTATLFAGLLLGSYLRRRNSAFNIELLAGCGLLALAICSTVLPAELSVSRWRPFGLYVDIGFSFATGVLLSDPKVANDSRDLLLVLEKAIYCLYAWRTRVRLRNEWLDYSLQQLIKHDARAAINRVLGKGAARLLVEENSDGLRELHDLKPTIGTSSESRLHDLLQWMDGGSIAVTGARGAGKSTLLRRTCSPAADPGRQQFCIYVSAPAEYVASEFLRELFQQVCDTYLRLHDSPVTGIRYPGLRARGDAMRAARGTVAVFRLALRSAFALTLLAIAFGPVLVNLHPMTEISHEQFVHWRNDLNSSAKVIWKEHQELIQIFAGLLALFWWPGKTIRQQRLGAFRRPTLIQRARDYSIHLKIERTTSRSANLGLPTVRGASVSFGKGTSEKYLPWSMPELVGKLRQFIADIADDQGGRIIIGIDEIDRIGSVEQAERFIGEIKAIFGIAKCFFLVSVAEDVGFLFSRRSVAGKSTLEHSFDGVVVVGPLGLDEAIEMLSARVPGFTESFVVLALALSGGLPREMIRVARRLVEVNIQQADHHPLIGDLALHLVAENVAEVLRTSRSQLAQLSLADTWGTVFYQLHEAMALLSSKEASQSMCREIIRELCSLRPPEAVDQAGVSLNTDEEAGAKIVSGLAAFACYSYTVIEAFDNDYFDPAAARTRMQGTAGESYMELAAARLELGISPESSQSIIYRFRAQSGLTPLPGSRRGSTMSSTLRPPATASP